MSGYSKASQRLWEKIAHSLPLSEEEFVRISEEVCPTSKGARSARLMLAQTGGVLLSDEGQWEKGQGSICPVCGRPFATPNRLHGHMGAHRDTPTKSPRRRKKQKEKQNPKVFQSIDEFGLDVILELLFPDGIPPQKYRQVVRWVEVTQELISG